MSILLEGGFDDFDRAFENLFAPPPDAADMASIFPLLSQCSTTSTRPTKKIHSAPEPTTEPTFLEIYSTASVQEPDQEPDQGQDCEIHETMDIEAPDAENVEKDDMEESDENVMESQHDEHEDDDDADKADAENADEEEDSDNAEDSGCDPDEEYHPYPPLLNFVGKKAIRKAALVEWFDGDMAIRGGDLKMATQSQDPDDPVRLPIMAKFMPKTNFQSAEEQDRGLEFLVVLVEQDGENFYLFFHSGSRLLEYTANVGEDDRMYPYPSLSSAGKSFTTKNCNGWVSFTIYDESSPHNGKLLRTVKEGPGFQNTFSHRNLVDDWKSFSSKTLNVQTKYQVGVFGNELAAEKVRILAKAQKGNINDNEKCPPVPIPAGNGYPPVRIGLSPEPIHNTPLDVDFPVSGHSANFAHPMNRSNKKKRKKAPVSSTSNEANDESTSPQFNVKSPHLAAKMPMNARRRNKF